MMELPKEVGHAIAQANASLFGIPPIEMPFSDAVDTIRAWADENLFDDPLEDDDGEPVEYDFHGDDKWKSREDKIRDLCGKELAPYI